MPRRAATAARRFPVVLHLVAPVTAGFSNDSEAAGVGRSAGVLKSSQLGAVSCTAGPAHIRGNFARVGPLRRRSLVEGGVDPGHVRAQVLADHLDLVSCLLLAHALEALLSGAVLGDPLVRELTRLDL